jgi:hypothetical protein
MAIPYSEVNIDQFEDPYQVPRVLRALLEAPKLGGALGPAAAGSQIAWLEKVLQTPILQLPS